VKSFRERLFEKSAMAPSSHGISVLPDGFEPPNHPPEPFVARAMIVEGDGARSLRVRGVKAGSTPGEGDLALFVRGERVVAIDATCPHQVSSLLPLQVLACP